MSRHAIINTLILAFTMVIVAAILVVGTDPISAMAELTQKNIARLQSLQEEMLRGFSPDSDASSAGNDADSSDDRKRTG